MEKKRAMAMNSREKILADVKINQPAFVELPPRHAPGEQAAGEHAPPQFPDPEWLAREFAAVLEIIGGSVHFVAGFGEIAAIIKEKFAGAGRILSNCPELSGIAELIGKQRIEDSRQGTDEDNGMIPGPADPHGLADTGLAILRARFGVAENAAVWMTEDDMIERALPFICQHLAVIIDKKEIFATMHEAYDRIGGDTYGFGVFIAGPSKTADIEQSLVLGAHGPVSMTVFILGD